jgi:hypothetical protein
VVQEVVWVCGYEQPKNMLVGTEVFGTVFVVIQHEQEKSNTG